jgi:hypothetical protein
MTTGFSLGYFENTKKMEEIAEREISPMEGLL